MLADTHISSLGYLWFYKSPFTVKLTKPWTPEIFMGCFCVAKRRPVRSEKPKPQTTRIVSLWFCGLLTCLELHCDWSLHNHRLVTTQSTFLKFFSHLRFSAFDSKDVNWVSWFNSITHAISKLCPCRLLCRKRVADQQLHGISKCSADYSVSYFSCKFDLVS